MRRVEVEAILGPPGDYRTGLGERSWGKSQWIPDPDPNPTPPSWNREFIGKTEVLVAIWLSDSFAIDINIESEQVIHKQVVPRRRTQGPLDNLVWRLRRQWHRWFPE
jgi:hypothetical protein